MGRWCRLGTDGLSIFGGIGMVTMILRYRKQCIVLQGTMADVMAELRAWCPSGRVVEIFMHGREQ